MVQDILAIVKQDHLPFLPVVDVIEDFLAVVEIINVHKDLKKS